MTSPSCIIQLTLNLEHNINSVWEICASSYTWKRGCKTGARVTAVLTLTRKSYFFTQSSSCEFLHQNYPAHLSTWPPGSSSVLLCSLDKWDMVALEQMTNYSIHTNSGSPTLRDNNLPLPWVGSKLHEECKQSSDPTQDRKLFWDQKDSIATLLFHIEWLGWHLQIPNI